MHQAQPIERKKIIVQPPKKTIMLNINQKRKLTFEWFKSADKIKDLDVARRFVRLAATDLELRALRKLRRQAGSDDEKIREIDSDALALINSYRPPRRFSEKQKNRKIEKMDRAAVRDLFVAFFDDPEMTPLIRFLRRNGAVGSRKEIFVLAKSIQIRKMRKRRGDDGVRAAALAKIDEVCNGNDDGAESCLELTNLTLEETKHRKIGKKAAATFKPDPKLRPLLVEWFDHPKKSFVGVLEEKNMLEERKSMRTAVIASGLRGKRQICHRANAMRTIDALFSVSEETDAGNATDTTVVTDVTVVVDQEDDREGTAARMRPEKAALTTGEQDRLKGLLTRWFYEDSDASVTEFVIRNGLEPELRPKMVRLVNRLGLRRIRKEHRAIRPLVARRIENAFGKKTRVRTGKKFAKMKTKKRNGSRETVASDAARVGMEDSAFAEAPEKLAKKTTKNNEDLTTTDAADTAEVKMKDEDVGKAPVFDAVDGDNDRNIGADTKDDNFDNEKNGFVVVE